ncbi:unnamed protein product, partial [Didymodactylos carnosus]
LPDWLVFMMDYWEDFFVKCTEPIVFTLFEMNSDKEVKCREVQLEIVKALGDVVEFRFDEKSCVIEYIQTLKRCLSFMPLSLNYLLNKIEELKYEQKNNIKHQMIKRSVSIFFFFFLL